MAVPKKHKSKEAKICSCQTLPKNLKKTQKTLPPEKSQSSIPFLETEQEANLMINLTKYKNPNLQCLCMSFISRMILQEVY